MPPRRPANFNIAVSGRYGPIPAWTRLIRELWRRWCIYRLRRADLHRLRYNEPAVHDYRVAAQRLMAGLRMANQLIDDPAVRRVRRLVRKRFHGLRRVRDVQVMALNLPTPRAQARYIWRLRRVLREEETEIRAGLQRHLSPHRDKAEFEGMRRIFAMLIARARRSSDAALTRILRNDLAEVQRQVQAQIRSLALDNLTTFHALRIGLKRARYKLELLAVSHDLPAAKAAYRTAQGWQDLLGTIRDLQVLQDELARVSPRGAAEEAGFRVFSARQHYEITEGVRTLLRQRKQLVHFGTTIQCLGPSREPQRRVRT